LPKKVPFSEKSIQNFLPTFTLQKWAEPGQSGQNFVYFFDFFDHFLKQKWAENGRGQKKWAKARF